jgi:hypothetical protein
VIYCFDIDNTICSPVQKGQYDQAKPWTDRINKVNELYNQGNKIIYYTARCSSKSWFYRHVINYFKTKKQLQSWGCLFHKLKVGKMSYDLWIDDKAVSDQVFFGGVS